MVIADERIVPDETTVPLLQCVSADETLAFWRALGFEVTWEQRNPYLYLAFRWSGFELHTVPHRPGSTRRWRTPAAAW